MKMYWNSVRVGIMSAKGLMLSDDKKNLVVGTDRGTRFRLYGISFGRTFIGIMKTENWADRV